MHSAEFQITDPSTGARTPLPDVETWAVSPISDGTGVVQLTYPSAGRSFALLKAFVDSDRDALLIVRIDGGETPSFTAVLTEAQGDSANPAAVWTFSGRFQAVYLEQAVIYPDPDSGTVTTNGGLADAQREFSSANGYQVIAPLMAEAQARGAAALVTYASFTNTHDSAGNAWAQVITTTCSPGVTMLALLNSLESNGLFEWTMTGADLRLYNPGTLGRDLTLSSPPVILHGPRDLTQASRVFSSKGAVTHLLVAGQQGLYTEADDPVAQARRGRRVEGYFSSGNTQDPGTLSAVAQAQLAIMSPGTLQVTHGLVMSGQGPAPLTDFDVYDWIWSDTGGGLERLQVRQWSVSCDSAGIITGTVTLNTLVDSRLAKLQQQIDAISGGQTVVGTSAPPPVTQNQIAPKVPVGETASSSAYIDNHGVTAAQVTAGWTAVTQNVNSDPVIGIAGYQVQWRYAAGQGLSVQWNQVPGPVTGTTVSWSPVVPGVTAGWEVQAVDTSGLVSGWSAESTLTTGADATPPPVASTPVVAPYLGQLKITWDGLGVASAPMPPDFARTEVHVSLTSGFTPGTATLTDQLVQAGSSVATDLIYGDTYFVKFVTVDRSGNKAAASAQASGVPVQATDGDVSSLSVGKLTAGILSAVVTLSGRFATALTGARVEMNSGGLFQYDSSGAVLSQITPTGLSLVGTITTKATSSGNSRIELGLDPNGDTMRVYDASNNQVVTIGQIYSGGTPVSNGMQVNNTSGDLIFRLYGSGAQDAQFYYVGKGLGTPFPYIQAHWDGVAGAMDFTLTANDVTADHKTGFTFFDTGDYEMRVTNFKIWGAAQGVGQTVLNLYTNGRSNPPTLRVRPELMDYTGTVASSAGTVPYVQMHSAGVDLTMVDPSSGGNRTGFTAIAGGVTLSRSFEHHVTSDDGSSFAPVFATAFNVVSHSDFKQGIAATPAGAGLAVVRQAPVRTWAYKSDPSRFYTGPLADDIPPEYRVTPGAVPGNPAPLAGSHLSLVNMLGLLQQAVYELDEELDQLRTVKPDRKKA